MKKIISIFLTGILLSLTLSTPVFALSSSPTPTPFPSSYVLFYPITAGKTLGDSFYFLKTAKEWLVDKLITEPTRKADYHLTLSKKRLVEAEKLFNESKYPLAQKSVTNSIMEISEAVNIVKNAKESGIEVVDITNTIKNNGTDEADFIDKTLVSSVPESQKQFLSISAQTIRTVIAEIN